MVWKIVERAGVLAASALLGFGGLAVFAEPASADCDVNLGTCGGGSCTVNAGYCEGNCFINGPLAYCGSGASCTVNLWSCTSSGGGGGPSLVVVTPVQTQEGSTCGSASITDPTGGSDVQTGVIYGGPMAAVSTDPNAPSADPTASLTLKCTIQVGPAGSVHAGSDAASASASGTGVVVLAPTLIDYVAPEGANVYGCTEVTVNGTTYYYDDTNGGFSTSNMVDCALAISQEFDPA